MATVSRESLCNIGLVQIPRPKCQGFQFVNTRGRMGFYRSIKRDGEKYGIQMKNMGPRRPQLPDAGFWKPPEESRNNNEEEKVNANHIQEKPTFARTFEKPPNYGTINKGGISGHVNSVKFSMSQNKTKQPPPAPPLPGDLARLPPRPPRVPPMKKRNDLTEPPVDYESTEDVRPQMFRRQGPVIQKHRTILEESENERPNERRSIQSSGSSKYTERF
ncbi:hypothetical protein FO519_004854 [Halicephalobus sp. NKZ332]|nr:hypothetical protein FO519_004854 [Halicephalobus sp. NKZ332]